jgi:hypothetical protein
VSDNNLRDVVIVKALTGIRRGNMVSDNSLLEQRTTSKIEDLRIIVYDVSEDKIVWSFNTKNSETGLVLIDFISGTINTAFLFPENKERRK